MWPLSHLEGVPWWLIGPVATYSAILQGLGATRSCCLKDRENPRRLAGSLAHRETEGAPRQSNNIPFHDDEEAALAVMHILIHIYDAHNVGATRGLPVMVHLLPGLGAIVQEL